MQEGDDNTNRQRVKKEDSYESFKEESDEIKHEPVWDTFSKIMNIEEVEVISFILDYWNEESIEDVALQKVVSQEDITPSHEIGKEDHNEYISASKYDKGVDCIREFCRERREDDALPHEVRLKIQNIPFELITSTHVGNTSKEDLLPQESQSVFLQDHTLTNDEGIINEDNGVQVEDPKEIIDSLEKLSPNTGYMTTPYTTILHKGLEMGNIQVALHQILKMEISKMLWIVLKKDFSAKVLHYTLILEVTHKIIITIGTLEVWEHGYTPSLSVILIKFDYFIHIMCVR